MRVLFWSDWFLPHIGGVETFSARLLPALVSRGHEVTVVAGHHQPGFPDQVDYGGVTVRRFWFHQILAAASVEGVAEAIAGVARLKGLVAPDLIHLNTLGPSVIFHLASSARRPVPVLLTMHSPVQEDATNDDTLYRRALRSADFVNCNSRAVRADLCRLLPEMGSRSAVTYYGMDPPALEAAPRPLSIPRVLAYGRLVEDKGFDLAIRAFALVVRTLPAARLVLAGDGPARPELERLAGECGVSDSVDFVGAVRPEDVPALINTASLVVVPSRWAEPFGLVALEAALMARPVVAARVGGLAEAVEDGATGILVDPEDFVALARSILHLLRDSAAADRMGWAGQARARRRFGWKRCVDDYEHLYQRIAFR